MKILSIETSCDETAVSLVEAKGDLDRAVFSVLGNALFSQVSIHKEYGGVYPMLAKREHAKNLPPLLKKALTDAGFFHETSETVATEVKWNEIEKILEREDGLYTGFKNLFENVDKPDIDVIAVTYGPGLEPALWVGISFAVALGKLWELPVVPANHMEGHITSILIGNSDDRKVVFPALALLISGGHTEIVEIKNWGEYLVIGETVDDAVGEAFDKVARMLELPYPGGPEISALAEIGRKQPRLASPVHLPRPMIHSDNLNFSFSGLKTAVLYYIRDNFDKTSEALVTTDKADIAREFEDAVIEVLLSKVEKALGATGAKTLIVAGGVIANKTLRERFGELESKHHELIVKIPSKELATDNSLMIACASYISIMKNPSLVHIKHKIVARGNVKLGDLIFL